LVLLAGAALALPMGASGAQVPVEARSKAILTVDGLQFRDLDGDGKLTPMKTGAFRPKPAPTI
jgi:beta-glucosidase